MSTPQPASDREREAKAKQAKEDYEFERPYRDMLWSLRAVKSMWVKAQTTVLLDRCTTTKPTDQNNQQPP